MWQFCLVVSVKIPRKNLHLQMVSSTAVLLHLSDPKPVHLGPRGQLAEGWLDPQLLSYARKTFFFWGENGWWVWFEPQ